MSNKRFLAVSVTSALVVSAIAPAMSFAEEIEFADFKKGDAHYEAVNVLAQQNIITGYVDDNTFRPNQPLTRGQGTKLFFRALQLQEPDNVDELITRYQDVKPGSEFAPYVAAMINASLLDVGDGFFQAGKPLTREEMATWLVRAFELESKEDIPVLLTDLDTISPIHVENVKILYQNGITTGKSDGSFAPTEPVKRGQFATFFYRSLYQIDFVERIDDIVVNVGDELQLPEKANVVLTTGKKVALGIEWDEPTIDTTKQGIYERIGTIIGSDKTITVTITVKEIPLEITNVEASNLRQIFVTFNHNRGVSTILENLSVYQLEDAETNKELTITDAQKLDNQVVLTLGETFSGSANLLINKEVTGDEFLYNIAFRDTTPPEISDVNAISKKQIKVTFSEPMNFGVNNGEKVTNRDFTRAFELDDENYSIKSITSYDYGKSIIIALYSELDEDVYTLNVSDTIRDFFGFKIDESEKDFTVEYDENPPQVTEMKNIFPNKVTVIFNKAIELADKQNILDYFHHTDRSIDAKKVEVINNNEVTITFDQEDSIEDSAAQIIIDNGALTDLWGNINETLIQEVSIRNDGTKPLIQTVTMIEEKETASSYVQLKVLLSEPVLSEDITNTDNYSLKTNDGKVVTIKKVDQYDSGEEVILTVDKRYGEFDNRTYTVVINQLSDLYENKNEDAAFTFNAGSMELLKNFTGTAIANEDKNEVVFVLEFDQEMETGNDPFSITDLRKYELSVNGTRTILNSLDQENDVNVDINIYNNGKKAELLLQKGDDSSESINSYFTNLANAINEENLENIQLVLGQVADVNGNVTESFFNIVQLVAKESFGVTAVDATDTDTIKLLLEDSIEIFDGSDFIVFADENNDEEFQASEQLDVNFDLQTEDGKSAVTITFDDENNTLNSDATFTGEDVYILLDERVDTVNRFGQKLEFSQLKVIDKITPELITESGEEKVYVHSLEGDSEKAVISLEFSEKIDEDTVTRLTFSVGDGRYEVTSTSVKDRTLYLVVNLNGDKVIDLEGEYIQQIAPISDLNNNLLENIEVQINDVKPSVDL